MWLLGSADPMSHPGSTSARALAPGERARCAVFIHWLYPDARIDWVSMNKHESDKILEQLRQRGEYIHPLSKVENIEEWRKDARRIARKASLRVRTIVDSDQSYVIVVDVDYEPEVAPGLVDFEWRSPA